MFQLVEKYLIPDSGLKLFYTTKLMLQALFYKLRYKRCLFRHD